jgi:hypothetical protein
MGGDGKPHTETITLVPDAEGKPASSTAATTSIKGLTITDKRVDKDTAPLNVDLTKFPLIYQLDGIPPEAEVDLRLETPHPGDPYGSTQHISGNKFIVKVFVLPLDKVQTKHEPGTYPDDALYVINNSLVHELRHVGQHYVYKQMDADYSKEMAEKGYKGNFYEKEAWLWGHYADATNLKGATTDYEGKVIDLPQWADMPIPETGFPGYKVWGLIPPGWKEPT